MNDLSFNMALEVRQDTIINYSVRIHDLNLCACNRIISIISNVKVKKNEKIVYVIERLWHDQKDMPRMIYIKEKKSEHCDEDAYSILKTLFEKSNENRQYVREYFLKYEWSFKKSCQIRDLVKKMPSICFCMKNILVNKSTCNSGFAIIGSKEKLSMISHCFNKYCHKTEIYRIFLVQISNLALLSNEEMGYSLSIFYKSKEFKTLDQSLYLLVGLQLDDFVNHSKKIFTLPFGKREWFSDTIESSFECAKRELYEEFNLQFSHNVWKQSCKLKTSPQIYYPGTMIYPLHIIDAISIKYHFKSDTIYLDI